jgi:peptidoglycan/xylan/chitin deacetylase (PgdA/CDA1 family)
MYHYVRPLQRTRYPAIRGLDTDRFDWQLDYLDHHYSVIGMADIVASRTGGPPLPPNAVLLSFDDGLMDHYETVFPRLDRRGWPAAFFPSARPVLEGTLLDVHKLQFVLATAREPRDLVARLLELVGGLRDDHELPSDESLWSELARPTRYDVAEVMFAKNLLQWRLPAPLRTAIVGRLFLEQVSDDEGAFSRELYMDLEQMRLMARKGMAFGGHGYHHVWLERLSEEEQRSELGATLQFLESIQPCTAGWAMCYPYGSYNHATLRLLGELGCSIAFTTRVDLATDEDPILALPRLDTNDLPSSGDLVPCAWTQRAAQVTGSRMVR